MCKTSCLSNLDETSPGTVGTFCHVATHYENTPCHSDINDLSRGNFSAPTIYEIDGRSPRIQTTSEVQTQLNSQRYLKGRICDVLSQVREERATPPTAPSTRSRLLHQGSTAAPYIGVARAPATTRAAARYHNNNHRAGQLCTKLRRAVHHPVQAGAPRRGNGTTRRSATS